MVGRKKRMTLVERLHYYEEQARQRQEEAGAKKAKPEAKRSEKAAQSAKPVAKRSTPRRLTKKAVLRRHAVLFPEMPQVFRCTIYFWQRVPKGPIKIGVTRDLQSPELREMFGPEEAPAHLLAVLDSDTGQAEAIHQRFAERRMGEEGYYLPSPGLRDFIEIEAEHWRPPSRAPMPPPKLYKAPGVKRKKSRPLVERACQCGAVFRTRSGDRYCDECEKKKRRELWDSGYLKPIQYGPYSWGTNFGAEREERRDPSPSQENAVRYLEGD